MLFFALIPLFAALARLSKASPVAPDLDERQLSLDLDTCLAVGASVGVLQLTASIAICACVGLDLDIGKREVRAAETPQR
jgi:hypothetical protein